MFLAKLHVRMNRPLRAKGNFISFRLLFKRRYPFARLYSVGGRLINEYGALVGSDWQGKDGVFGE
jgi:hypothetical protein